MFEDKEGRTFHIGLPDRNTNIIGGNFEMEMLMMCHDIEVKGNGGSLS